MKAKPRKRKPMPQWVKDDILCFLYDCGTKTKIILVVLLFNAITEVIQIILWLLKLVA